MLRLLREILALRRDIAAVREALAAVRARQDEDHALLLRMLGDPEEGVLPLIIGPVTEQRLTED